jgi:hypothetical protein
MVWLLWSAEPGPPAAPDEPAGETTAAPAAPPPTPTASTAGPAQAAAAASSRAAPAETYPGDDHEHHVEDPTGDLELYERRPMSAVPHRVVRGWGARGSGRPTGAVGAFVVVDPEISDAELEALAEDIRRYHGDATALSVRILDSEHAATYDRHSDGGALAAAHLVGRISRNEQLGTDRVEIRGRVQELAVSEPR